LGDLASRLGAATRRVDVIASPASVGAARTEIRLSASFVRVGVAAQFIGASDQRESKQQMGTRM
jgi:hypothetical protein